MAGFTIRVDDAQIRTALGMLRARLGNMQPVMDAIGGRLVGLARIGFVAERSPDGTPWQPLTASTRRTRARRGSWPGPILRVSGTLFGSLAWAASPDAVEIGAGGNASRAYAAIHQFGGRVLRPLRRGVLRFRIARDGTSRFASKARANTEKNVTFGGRPIVIPARPYLPTSGTLPDAYLATCLDVINQMLGEVANG